MHKKTWIKIIMPVGCLRWMFHRKRPFDVDGQSNVAIKAGVVGLYDKARHITTQEEVEMITVFFHPYAAKEIMGIPSRLCNTDSFCNPMVMWGKYRKGWFKTTLPISFQFHHVQMDGGHAALFLKHLSVQRLFV